MPKKYKKLGVLDLLGLVTELNAQRWVFYRGRPLHPNFIRNMSFNTILGGVRGGLFALAVDKEACKKMFEERAVCACVDSDAYECHRRRYQHSEFFDDTEKCSCPCHDDDEGGSVENEDEDIS